MGDQDDRTDGLHADNDAASERTAEYTPEQLDPWAILRSLADTHKQLAQALANKATPNGDGFNGVKARVLAGIKIPPFEGTQNTTTRQYKEWRKSIAVIKQLNGLEDKDVAMLLFSQLTGRAKELIEILELEDFQEGRIMEMIWQIFDNAFEKMEHQRLHEVNTVWEKAHRKHGQPMQDWCNYLRKARLDLQIQNTGSTISDKSLASKMLRDSGISTTAQSQVLFNCGAEMNSLRMENVLMTMHSDIQHHERRNGQVVPHKKRYDKYERRDNKDRGRPPKTYTKSQWKPSNPYKTNRVHEAEVHEDDESHADE